MSTPKKNRKTSAPNEERFNKHPEDLSQQTLSILQQNTNKVVNLPKITGATTHQVSMCVSQLISEGHNIKGYNCVYMLYSEAGLPIFPESSKPVFTVDGDTLTVSNGRDTITAPLEAWRQALLKVGLIPESAIPETNPAVSESATPETADAIPETNRKSQEQTGKHTGRPPKAEIPADLAPLLKVFQECSEQRRPLYRTGKQGVFARKGELPEEFRQIGRDRLERLVLEMIQDGSLNLPHLTPTN